MAGELIGRSACSLELSPGAIELSRPGSGIRLAGRAILTLLLLPFVLFPLLLLFEPDIPTNLPAVLFYAVWYGALAGFAGLAGVVLSRWTLVRFDGTRGRLELRGARRFLWLPRRVSVPFDRVRGLRLTLGPEGLRPLAFVWSIEYEERGRGRRMAHVTATVEAIDRREEALDLACRIARLLGWKAIEIGRSDHLALEARLARSEADLAEPRPLPELPPEPGYVDDEPDVSHAGDRGPASRVRSLAATHVY